MPVDTATRALIARSTLYHFTKPRFAEKIRRGTAPGSNYELIHLQAFSGWSPRPTKLIRDWSVWDTDFTAKSYAKYLYFFLGEPSPAERRFLRFQGITVSVCIDGSDLLRLCEGAVFFRRSDKAVVVRGDYQGPAFIET